MNIQIANYHISDKSKTEGTGKVFLTARQDAVHAGMFKAAVNVSFDPAVNDYPTGSVTILVDLSDSFKGTARSTTIEQVNTHGKHTPTAVITGRCNVTLDENATAPRGCRFWILVSNNRRLNDQGTPDVISFIVYDRSGKRVAYGSGPATEGDITVAPSTL